MIMDHIHGHAFSHGGKWCQRTACRRARAIANLVRCLGELPTPASRLLPAREDTLADAATLADDAELAALLAVHGLDVEWVADYLDGFAQLPERAPGLAHLLELSVRAAFWHTKYPLRTNRAD